MLCAFHCAFHCFSTLPKACLSSDFLIRFTTKRPKVSCANGCTVPLVPHRAMRPCCECHHKVGAMCKGHVALGSCSYWLISVSSPVLLGKCDATIPSTPWPASLVYDTLILGTWYARIEVQSYYIHPNRRGASCYLLLLCYSEKVPAAAPSPKMGPKGTSKLRTSISAGPAGRHGIQTLAHTVNDLV